MPSHGSTGTSMFNRSGSGFVAKAIPYVGVPVVGATMYYFSTATLTASAASAAPAAKGAAAPTPISPELQAVLNATGLDPATFRSFRVKSVEKYNHNTNIYTFELKSSNAAHIPCASYILARAKIGNEEVVRPYTPLESAVSGTLKLMIKSYEKGKLSKHIGTLKVGDSLDFKGPNLKLKYEPNMKKEIGMIAGGTGITPMLQVINEVLSNPKDKTKLTLLFANVTEDDILLREKFDSLTKQYKNFTVYYVLDKPPSSWKGGKGYVTDEYVKKFMPAPGRKDSLILVCGPPGMMGHVSGDKAKDYTQGPLAGLLLKLGYQSSEVFKF